MYVRSVFIVVCAYIQVIQYFVFFSFVALINIFSSPWIYLKVPEVQLLHMRWRLQEGCSTSGQLRSVNLHSKAWNNINPRYSYVLNFKSFLIGIVTSLWALLGHNFLKGRSMLLSEFLFIYISIVNSAIFLFIIVVKFIMNVQEVSSRWLDL